MLKTKTLFEAGVRSETNLIVGLKAPCKPYGQLRFETKGALSHGRDTGHIERRVVAVQNLLFWPLMYHAQPNQPDQH